MQLQEKIRDEDWGDIPNSTDGDAAQQAVEIQGEPVADHEAGAHPDVEDLDPVDADLEDEAPAKPVRSKARKLALFGALAASVSVIAVSAAMILAPTPAPQGSGESSMTIAEPLPEETMPSGEGDLALFGDDEEEQDGDATESAAAAEDLFNFDEMRDDAFPEDGDADAGGLTDLASDIMDDAADPEPQEDELAGMAEGSTFSDDSMDLSDLFLGVDTPEEEEVAEEIIEDDLPPAVAMTDFEALMESVMTLDENTQDLYELAMTQADALANLENNLELAVERAERAESLALAQNQVLVRFVAAEEKLEIAEQLIVDLSRRVSSVEGIDAADREDVDERLTTLDNQLRGLQRDVGMVARMAINGSPTPTSGRAPSGQANFDSATDASMRSPVADPSNVPADAEVGDHVNGYGTVLEIFATSDGGRMVVMENGSVIQN